MMYHEKKLQQPQYFTEFDAFRFFAAFITAFYHADIVKEFYKTPDRPIRNWGHLGNNSVTFFFVLSGFLITLLLIREKANYGTINIRAFYLRRVFRIWPLYYLILLSGLFVIPYLPMLSFSKEHLAPLQHYSVTDYLLLISFFPNIGKAGIISDFWLISFCWSVGMEEQFYLFWPHIIKNIKRFWIPIVFILIAFLSVRYVYLKIYPNELWFNIFTYFRFDNMALGGLLALYYVKFDKHRLSAFIKKRYSLYLALALSFCVTLFSIPFASPFVPFVYGFLLLALAMQPGAIPLLNNSVLRYLGQISYGIYMFNILVSVLALNIILHLSSGQLDVFVEHFWLANIAYYTLALGGTLWLSHLSYQHYERPFLKLKEKFAKV